MTFNYETFQKFKYIFALLIQKIKNTILFTALSMLLLHSFMPHRHHDELSAEEHIEEHNSASSVFDYLAVMFHENLGENHLEHFDTPASHFEDLATSAIVPDFYAAHDVGCIEIDIEFAEKPNSTLCSVCTKTSSKRGPPMA